MNTVMVVLDVLVFLFKLKTAYEMRISDLSSDVCSSRWSSSCARRRAPWCQGRSPWRARDASRHSWVRRSDNPSAGSTWRDTRGASCRDQLRDGAAASSSSFRLRGRRCNRARSEEHTSELQSLMRISYAVFCLKKKTKKHNH